MAARVLAVALAGSSLLIGCSPAAGHTPMVIRIEGQTGFEPASASVRRGGSLVWWNDDEVVHHIKIGDDPVFDVVPGDVVVTRLNDPGTFVVYDQSRPETMAVVTVGSSS